VATSNASQKQTVEMALKATELFYSNLFDQAAGQTKKPVVEPKPKTAKKR